MSTQTHTPDSATLPAMTVVLGAAAEPRRTVVGAATSACGEFRE